MVACVFINKSNLDFPSPSLTHTKKLDKKSFYDGIWDGFFAKTKLCLSLQLVHIYISVYQYSIDNVYQYSNVIGQVYPLALMVIPKDESISI
jgi:hypothetical protein